MGNAVLSFPEKFVGTTCKANAIAAALDSEIVARASSRQWNLLRGG